MKISSVFGQNDFIPKKYTCDGEDLNPPVKIESLPDRTKSLAIIVEDPDAPGGTFVHWLVWNIEPSNEIEEGIVKGNFKEGRNDFGRQGYNGPCPPHFHGIHHYHFKVYALDTFLELPLGSSREQLQRAMNGHIISSAELVGLYKR